ncbi:hypothetical protein EX972_02080 [Salmonella enterica subsp. enterica serovar Teshie]|nr:hypothetical protein [Salmonella enterica subsp. enterica serovar Teshie]ECD2689248.1 hypothetical protein [Salmonella enterica subsp. enterica serovar Teshie]ECD2952833.1 hypothetical protein [Salmonella enterica subsp. enterica serovar Teshie]EEE7591581.1 hypothetical protein [Salmonella enterica subsp. enterica serovar Teshie]
MSITFETQTTDQLGHFAWCALVVLGLARQDGKATNQVSEYVFISNVKIIAATTEAPESHLLRTFTRRFPITIRLPALRERTLQERIKLVHSFLQTESKSIQCSISISGNALRAFYIYDCPNNIGQLRADLRSACAKAYVDYVTGIR